MNLTVKTIQAAKPRTKSYKMHDGRGLYLQIPTSGNKRWRMKYRYEGKEKLLTLGTYPSVSLKQARDRCEGARQMLARGIDPSENQKQDKQTVRKQQDSHFASIAREWLSRQPYTARHKRTVVARLENNVFPWIGDQPIEDVTLPQILAALRRIENRGAIESAHRVKSIISQVFRYAVATGRAERDVTADLRGALPPVKTKHMAAVTEPSGLAEILRAFDDYHGSHIVRCALQFMPLVFVRPGELRHAQWKDINLESRQWRFVASKTHSDHIVPLSRQAITILEDIRPLTETSRYVFPSHRSLERPMSENTVLVAMRSLGIDKAVMSGHGFRATARTLLEEVLHYPAEYIEQQLAHAVRDPLGRAYNRTKHLEERTGMMQHWADYLDALRSVGKVIPLADARAS
jgi:integrase